MAPKRWNGEGRNPRNSATAQTVNGKELVERFARQQLSENNLLGLGDEELTGAATQMATCATKKEVFDWCATMMLAESVAAEIVKRRDDHGPPFEGIAVVQKAPAAAAPAAPASAVPSLPADDVKTSKTGSKTVNLSTRGGVGGKDRRGAKKVVPGSDAGNGKPLIEGQYFECGCFALSHPFAGNCHNCGRIFCKQESMDEACYFCGFDPKMCIAYEIKVQTGLIDEASRSKDRDGFAAAVGRRDQLLKYAKEKMKRTTVIDDQSGVFLESRNAWMSNEERAAAEDAEASERRRKIALHHKRSGAYTVHLDIVNQNVALGARVDDLDERPPVNATSGDGGDEDRPDADEAANLAPWDDEQFPELQPCAADDSADEELEENAEGLRRVVANPAVAFATGTVSVRIGAAAQAPLAGGVTFKAAATRVIHESVRLQNDYYAEDKIHWAQQRVDTAFRDAPANRQSDAMPTTAFDFSHLDSMPKAFFDVEDNAMGGLTGGAAASSSHLVGDDVLRHFEAQADTDRNHGIPRAMRQKDDGMCLSMHQPWASLLVAGIKTHEGRTWSSEHRGRLWIHAAAAKPLDIASVEAHYHKFCPVGTTFPDHYPTSCLLGYVYVMDCLDHATYTSRFTPEEQQEDSPFKFICAGARALPMPLAMDGKHKIFKMDRKMWIAAKKQLGEPLQ